MNNEREFKDLPEGWKWVRLGDKDYFKIIGSGIEYFEKFKNYISTNSVQGTKITHIEDVITYKNRPSRANMQPKKGRLTFAKMRNTVKVLLIDEKLEKDYILSTGFALIEATINPKFVYQYLISHYFNRQKDILAEGTTQEAISNDDFNKIFIIFPENKFEQQKIAEILETVDNAIEKTEKIIEKYKRIKQGLMQDLLTKGIDENGNIRDEKTHKFKDSPLGKIPEEWEVVRLGEVGEIVMGQSPASALVNQEGNGIPFLQGSAEFGVKYPSPKNWIVKPLKLAPNNSILISIRAPVGDLNIANSVYCIGRGLSAIKVNNSKVYNYFIWFILYLFRDMLVKMSQGSTFEAVGYNELNNFQIPLPTLPEQQRIASILSQIDQTIEKEEYYKEKLQKIKQGLMQDLLTGKVRVNHLVEEKENEQRYKSNLTRT